MPQDLFRNSQICSMVAEGEVANILSHFDSDYVMTIIRNHLQNRFTYSSSVMTKPNIVVSYDMTFKELLDQYPFDRENILTVRQDSYREIINTICSFYGLQFYPPDNDVDLYSAAYFLYECFVSKFDFFVTKFFANFVVMNRDTLWDTLDLARFKKDKDSTTLYGKKAYDNIKMAVIMSKMNEILYYLLAIDVDLPTFISSCYPVEEANFINTLIYSEDFYKTHVCPAIQLPNIITDIKLKIHQMLCEEQYKAKEIMYQASNGDTIYPLPEPEENELEGEE